MWCLGPVDPSFRALSGFESRRSFISSPLLKFTVRRLKFNQGCLSVADVLVTQCFVVCHHAINLKDLRRADLVTPNRGERHLRGPLCGLPNPLGCFPVQDDRSDFTQSRQLRGEQRPSCRMTGVTLHIYPEPDIIKQVLPGVREMTVGGAIAGPKPSTRNPVPENRNPTPRARNPKPEIRN